MARRLLTDKGASRLRPKRKPFIVWDAGATGLGLRVRPSGTRTWIMNMRWPGTKAQARRVLGAFDEKSFGVDAARAKAREWYALAKNGVDPQVEADKARQAEERKRVEEAARQSHTFAAFAERYIGERTNRRARSDAQEIRRLLVKPWADRPLGSITPSDVEGVIEEIMRRSAFEARGAWQHASQIFRLAVHKRVILASPLASLDKRIVFRNVTFKPRERILDADELRALWRAATRIGYPAGPILQLLLLTGARRNEIAQASWSELHPTMRQLIRESVRSGQRVSWAAVSNEYKTLTIPPERFKSGVSHTIQLSDWACSVIEVLPRTGGSYLFSLNGKRPSWALGTTHLRGRPGRNRAPGVDQRMLRTLKALARVRGDDPKTVKLKHWQPHDLRRVVRSGVAALGVEDHIGEMILGHGRRGIQRVYDVHRYSAEIRDALEGWAAKLRTIVEPVPPSPTGDNVVPLTRRKA